MADDVRPAKRSPCCSDLDAVEQAANARADEQAPEWFVDGEDRVWVSRDEEEGEE